MTEATRYGYQDERLPIEQLLDAKGFLKGLSPIYRHRKVWEAWKHAHGLHSSQRTSRTPYGLDHRATESIETADEIRRVRPLAHGDERAMESAALVDQLFDGTSSAARARLLTQIALTFDGIQTASLRRQLVDVIGSHLIGLDDEPMVGYTGRHLTQEERTAAANALRIARSPHSLYYLEKFTENEGRSYACNTSRGMIHYRTSATVRKAVVYAVEGMLDDIDRSTYYANRNHTWRMQNYVTDVGRLRDRLAQLNSHLYTYAGSSLTRYKAMPLPLDASGMPTTIRRLWQQLTKVPDQQLTALKALLDQLLQSPGENGKWIASESSYVERTRRVVELLLRVGDDRWTDFKLAIAESARLIPALASLPELNAERPIVHENEPAKFNIPAGERTHSLWGSVQTSQLHDLDRHARTILASDISAASPDTAERCRAVDAVAAILDRHRAVHHAYQAYLGELGRLESTRPFVAAKAARAELDQRIRDCGGFEVYYQIVMRRTNDPNRILYETALDVLVAASKSRGNLDHATKTRADRYLVGLGRTVLSRGVGGQRLQSPGGSEGNRARPNSPSDIGDHWPSSTAGWASPRPLDRELGGSCRGKFPFSRIGVPRSEVVKNQPLGVSPMPSTWGARASRPQRIAENSRAGRPRTAQFAPNRFPREPDANAGRLITLREVNSRRGAS